MNIYGSKYTKWIINYRHQTMISDVFQQHCVSYSQYTSKQRCKRMFGVG